MSKTKIIHILPHSPSKHALVDYKNANLPNNFVKIDKSPGWAGFFENDWHVQIGREIRKSTNKFDVECWRFYKGLDKQYSKIIDGVKHKIFPSIEISVPLMRFEISPELIKLIKDIPENNKTIIHFHGLFGVNNIYNQIKILKSKASSFKLVVHDHGGISKLKKYIDNPNNPINYLLHKIEKRILNRLDTVFYSNSKTLKYLDYLNYRKRRFSPMGFYPDNFSISYSKRDLRIENNLPAKNKIFLIYGYTAAAAGFFTALEAARYFEKKDNDISFLFIGGFKEDYENLNLKDTEKIKFLTRMPTEILCKYYKMVDGFIFPGRTAGVSVMTLEALYCELPVASTPVSGSVEILKNKVDNLILFEPDNLNSLIVAIEELRTKSSSDNREIVKKHFSWRRIIDGYVDIYSYLENIIDIKDNAKS